MTSIPEVSGRGRLSQALRRGMTLPAAAAAAGLSLPIATLILEEMKRLGSVQDANSLCSSGLGACSSSGMPLSDEVSLHCSGCPLMLRGQKKGTVA